MQDSDHLELENPTDLDDLKNTLHSIGDPTTDMDVDGLDDDDLEDGINEEELISDLPQELTQSYGTGVYDMPGYSAGGRTMRDRQSRYTEAEPYDLLLYVANWPAARTRHWRTLLQARAIENLCYVAGVNRIGRDGNNLDYDGHSAVATPQGEELLQAGTVAGVH